MRCSALVIVDGSGRWVLAKPRLRDRLAVRLSAARLNADLATGVAAHSSTAHALRADILVDPRRRAHLAHHWLKLIDAACSPPRPGHPRLPVARTDILNARTDIAELAEALINQPIVTARGVALAEVLLTDGGGPVYTGTGRRGGLKAMVREALEHLNPLTLIDL